MNSTRDILEKLLDGIDPVTGEVLPDGHVCTHPAVIRALHHAIHALHVSEIALSKDTNSIDAKWSPTEKNELETMFRQGISIPFLAARFRCSEAAIKARLFYMGLCKEAPSILPKKDE